ncbi:MAG TPA: DinB family protein [Pyrinomonadaceae bacterium]
MTDTATAFIAQSRSILLADSLPRIERCFERLSDEQVWWRPNEDANSIGNLVLHLSGNVRQWIVCGLGGQPDTRARQEEFDERRKWPRAMLLQRLKETLAEADATLAAFEPSQLLEARHIQGRDVTGLEAIYHVVEHFSMHTGQIILLTKIIRAEDLRFYDFSGGAPVETWHEPST